MCRPTTITNHRWRDNIPLPTLIHVLFFSFFSFFTHYNKVFPPFNFFSFYGFLTSCQCVLHFYFLLFSLFHYFLSFFFSQTLIYFFLIRLRLEDFNLVNLGWCKLKMYVFFKRFCLFVSLISWKEESQKTIWSNCFHFDFFLAHEIKWVVPDWPDPQLLIAPWSLALPWMATTITRGMS